MREFGKSAHEAAVDAMREVFSAVVVIGIVLVAVFLPVAFFPGTTGPHVSAVRDDDYLRGHPVGVQRHHVHAGAVGAAARQGRATRTAGSSRASTESSTAGRTSTCARCGGALRWKWAMALVFVLSLGATWWVYRAVPGAFVPAEDEGYFITIVQAPSGASIEYTTNIMKQVEQIYFKQPEIAGVFSVAGFSFSGAASNSGLMFARLKGFEEREGAEHSLDAVLNRLRGAGLRHSRRDGHSRRAPVHSGRLGVRRVPVRNARPRRRRHHRARGGDPAGGRRRQPVGAGGRVCSRASRPTIRSSLVTIDRDKARAASACRSAR